jgi:prepilin-type N-terminal cleavage/methylation domain-containing protein
MRRQVMKNGRVRTSGQAAFTLIEIMIVVAIIIILASITMVGMSQSRKNARLNGAKTSVRSILTAIVGCKDSGGNVMVPSNPETGLRDICNPTAGFSGAKWPALSGGYTYDESGDYDRNDCLFNVNTKDDVTNKNHTYLLCDCVKQICE